MNLKDKLDKVFSEYIRIRDADQNGFIRCISCGKSVFWKEADAGHYINRKHLSLRFNEINVNAQCRSCNRFDEGNIPAYGMALQGKYGKEIIEKLLASKNQTMKLGRFEIEQLTKDVKTKLSQLKKEKGL